MTPTEKIKLGKKIASDISKRYKNNHYIPANESLSEALKADLDGLNGFFDDSNLLYKNVDKEDVFSLLLEKGLTLKSEDKKRKELIVSEFSLKQKSIKDLMKATEIYKGTHEFTEEDFESAVSDTVEMFKKDVSELPNLQDQILHLKTINDNLNEQIKAVAGERKLLERDILRKIQKHWKNGTLKHALITKRSLEVTKKKTTISRAVSLNTLYPEQVKSSFSEYGITDIYGLDKVEAKHFQALMYVANKAKNQTKEETWVVDFWKSHIGEVYADFELVAFKDGEYTEHIQGKDKSLVSGQEKTADIEALETLKDLKFHLRWEDKREEINTGSKRKYVVTDHELVKRVTEAESPLSVVEEFKGYKKIQRYHVVGVPKRLFSYKEQKTGEKSRAIFEVINFNPEFFSTLKYSDPEKQRITDALFKYGLLILTEASYGKGKFAISEEKLMKRIGLIQDNEINMGRQKILFDEYTTKLINQGTITSAEKKEGKIIFSFEKKQSKKET